MQPSMTALAGQKAASRLGGRVKMPISENSSTRAATHNRADKGVNVHEVRWRAMSPMGTS